jgi:hypothetical protein
MYADNELDRIIEEDNIVVLRCYFIRGLGKRGYMINSEIVPTLRGTIIFEITLELFNFILAHLLHNIPQFRK